MSERIIVVTSDGFDDPAIQAYLDALEQVGGRGQVVCPDPARRDFSALTDRMAGLVLGGGWDPDSALFGQALHPRARLMDPRRQEMDLALLAEACRRDLPVLGICLGCQLMAIWRGGSLHQHLPDVAGMMDHGGLGRETFHLIEPASRSAGRFGIDSMQVNSRHHQGICAVGAGMEVLARSPDGLVEAVCDPARGFFVGVQWHPENLVGQPPHRRLFSAFVESCGG